MNRTTLTALLCGAGLGLAMPLGATAWAGPVLCTTTLEAPVATAGPVEITRCGPTQSVPELMTRRSYTYTAPFDRGIDLTHQVTDVLGIAMGGGDGARVMGLGFPDQTLAWDGQAIQNTTAALLEAQSSPLPLRTADLGSCFTTSMIDSGCHPSRARLSAVPAPPDESGTVRGLW